MRVFLWQGCQKLRKIINVHIRHATLHGTQQMVIKGGYIYILVDHKMEDVPGEGIKVTNCSGNSSMGLCA